MYMQLCMYMQEDMYMPARQAACVAALRGHTQ
jgi:hypothetical protein